MSHYDLSCIELIGELYSHWTNHSQAAWRGSSRVSLCLLQNNWINIKGALDKCNIIPNFFSEKLRFFTKTVIGIDNDCMLILTF